MTHRKIEPSKADIRYDPERDGVWISDEVFLPRRVVVACLQELATGDQR